MHNGGNVAFLWVSGLSSIYSSYLFLKSANSRAIGFYCQIWQDFRFTSLLQQTNWVRKLQVCWFLKTYNISSTLPRFYQNNTTNSRNNVQNDKHYFKVYINDNDDVYAYIYIPINKVKRCVCLEMLYRTSNDIYICICYFCMSHHVEIKIISCILLYVVVVNH